MNNLCSFTLHKIKCKILKITQSSVFLLSSGLTTSATCNMSGSIAENRKMYLEMPIGEKRSQYKCGNKFVTLDKVQTWAETFNQLGDISKVDSTELQKHAEKGFGPFTPNPALNQLVSMWEGDITTMEIDAIVNAANESLRGGGGVDGAIHRAAGPELKAECISLNGCKTGHAKITGGYKLPAKYVIHTVGPRGEKPDLLQSCYQNCLDILHRENLRSIAFPCISTGIYGYPQENAAKVALTTVRKFMDQHPGSIDRVIFCLFLKEDIDIYRNLMQIAFPNH